MKKLFLVIATCAVFFPRTVSPQNWQFLSVAGCTGDDEATAVTVEPTGSACYGAGIFTDSITFGQTTLIATGTTDAYVTKYSSNGTSLWAIRIGGNGETYITDIAYMTNSVYVSGYFSGSTAIGGDSITSVGGTDMFVFSLNTASGSLVWLERFGGVGDDSACAISIGMNSLCIGAAFEGTWMFGTDTLRSCGGTDALVASLDLAGAPQWSRIGGGLQNEYVQDVGLDAAGNCYALGSYTDTAAFGSVTLFSSGACDLFIAKYGVGGTWGWIRAIYGTGDERAAGLASESFGYVYVAGTTTSPLLCCMSQTITNLDSVSGFLVSYDANGYASWVRMYPRFTCRSVSCSNAHVFVAGSFSDTCFFGQGQYVASGLSDICIFKCSTAGILQGIHQCGGVAAEEANALAVDQNNTLYLAGSFLGLQTAFIPYVAQNADVSGQTHDAYVGKFPALLLAVGEYFANEYVVYPNPFTDYLIVELPATFHEVVLFDMTGKEIVRTSGVGDHRIDRADLAVGMYILTVTDTEGVAMGNMRVSVQ